MNVFINNVIWIEKTSSTNYAVKDLFNKKLIDFGTILFAKEQTAGKGQRGNTWQSEIGRNLTFSILIDPEYSIDKNFFLSKYIAITCFRFIGKYCKNTTIKWPNDIYVNNRKIAGILIENNFSLNKISQSIIGVGININQIKFDENINATSFAVENEKEFDLKHLANEFVEMFNENISDLKNYKLLNSIYHKYMYLINTPHIFTLENGDKFEGVIKKTTDLGLLEIETSNGVKYFDIKEVKF